MKLDRIRDTAFPTDRRRLGSARTPARTDQNLRCPPEDVLDTCLPIARPVKTLMRCADAQADLSLRSAQCNLVGNAVPRLI